MLRRNFAIASIVFGLSLLAVPHAAATAQRTFVASYGLTANTAFNCSITKPCRAFSEAIGVTNSGGEVVVLDSAGYGPTTISKSVSIIAPAGVHAGISVFAGSNGINIPGAGIKVVLRGLSISGQGGGHGIYVSGSNELAIERCDIGGMSSNGIFLDGVSGTVQIRDTVVHDNAANGVMLFGALSATLESVTAERNALAGIYVIDGPSVTMKNGGLIRNDRGLEVTNFAAVVTEVHGAGMNISRNAQEGIRAITGTGTVFLQLVRSEVNGNLGSGVLVESTGGDLNTTLSDNAFAHNGGLGVSGIGVELLRPVGPIGDVRALISRNVFAEVKAVRTLNLPILKSDGGNSAASGTTTPLPDLTASF